MPESVLAVVFLVVMGAALVCFWTAFFVRKRLRRHKAFGVAGAAIDLTGTAAVIVASRVLGWHVSARDADVAAWHRSLAYAATALVLLVAITGAARAKIHTKLWPLFLPVYTATYALAAWAYGPFGR